jgi:hypothetical protein
MPSSASRPSAFADTPMREMKWSPTEKVIAQRAFDLALGGELQSLMLEAKSKAAKLQEPSDLWELEQYLTQLRQEIDRTFDYLYSVLPAVFGNLLRSGRLGEDDCAASAKTN